MVMWGRALRGLSLSSMLDPRRASSDERGDERSVQQGNDDDCRRSMRTVLETQIIPRLVQAHRQGSAHEVASPTPRPRRDDILALARRCSAGDRAGAARIIEELRSQGLEQDVVLVDLIGPAARYLGEQWEDDRASFSDVTVGLVLMHELIHALGYEVHDGPQESSFLRRVMLASAPGYVTKSLTIRLDANLTLDVSLERVSPPTPRPAPVTARPARPAPPPPAVEPARPVEPARVVEPTRPVDPEPSPPADVDPVGPAGGKKPHREIDRNDPYRGK